MGCFHNLSKLGISNVKIGELSLFLQNYQVGSSLGNDSDSEDENANGEGGVSVAPQEVCKIKMA